eukprot:s15861_g1.t1
MASQPIQTVDSNQDQKKDQAVASAGWESLLHELLTCTLSARGPSCRGRLVIGNLTFPAPTFTMASKKAGAAAVACAGLAGCRA